MWYNAIFWCTCQFNNTFYFPEVAEPDTEEGEIIPEGSKDKYDINKIISYPGFNVPCSPDTIDASISDIVYFDYFG